MALSNGKFPNNGPLIFLSPVSKKTIDGKSVKVDPHFKISRVGADNKIAETTETATEVSGNLLKIEFKEREFNGQVNKHVILLIKDGADTYYLDLTYRIATRSLFNALLNLESSDNISIGYYESKKGFEAFSLRQNDAIVKWKFDIADQPKAEEIKDKKGVVIKTDYSEVDAFFEDALRELAVKLFGESAAKPEVKAAQKKDTPTEASVTGPDKDSDVPF